ncbi:MAG: hypothetical protein C0405_11120 [Desulfovibrio sp.]|nr:hypothetical protein [Desulfovibrio sp.]
MTSRRFLLQGLGLALGLACALVALNIGLDEFGLFGMRTGPIRIWGYERASKFLLARRHVPEHFEGLLLGSSSADMMMDTRLLHGYAVYNLSISGGNICEVARISQQALERGRMRFLVLSLSPYLTKDCVMKTNELNPGLEHAALGSLFTLRFYQSKLNLLLHPERDSFRDSWSGFQHDIPLPPGEAAMGARERPLSATSPVDAEAALRLAELLQTARQRGVRVLAYFHPLLHSAGRGSYPEAYLRQMLDLFRAEEMVWDFNDGSYPAITEDSANFFDGTHLSGRGAGLVLAEIGRRLDAGVGRDPARAKTQEGRP